MTTRSGWRPAVSVLVAALAATLAAEPAEARKNKVAATVNGKRLKWKGRFVSTGFSGAGTILTATKPARPRGVIRTLAIGCAIYPPNETFPLTPLPQICNASYSETKVAPSVSVKGWLAVQGVHVVYESFGGGRITGTFSGTLGPLSGGASEPLVIEGTFDTSTQGE